MANTSRRGLLAGIAATSAAGISVQVAAAPMVEPSDAAFLHWLDLAGAGNSSPSGLSDDEWELVEVAERAFIALPATPAKALTLALHELSYLFSEMRDRTVEGLLSGCDQDARFALRIVLCLRSGASGRVAQIVADLFDEPTRPTSEILLCRYYAGVA
ncbi:hypothetical protein [uncultured Enterovirga sp.]|uniref:hypothetical protein n=1 Tax=uncultured Enterovirga sp. TaxID=2026352 RepID=UPI0035C986C7